MKKLISAISCMLVLMLCLTACSQPTAGADTGISLRSGGTLVLRVNPEIAVEYDENGLVTGVVARNEDAIAVIDDCTGLIGGNVRDAVTQLVAAIGTAGYFIEEVEGEGRQITLEIEAGSSIPHDEFLDELVSDIRAYVSENHWDAPLVVEGESAYGVTDYDDTDYGPNNDGVTDYDDTDYGPNNDGVTDYDDTDYGPNNDGVTDYDDTDYGPNNDGVTDYDDTDYGPSNDGVTDYDDTDYGPSNDGVTDYDDTDYGPNNDGVTDYDDTDYGPNNDGVTDYNDTDYGDSGYEAESDYSDYEAESDYSDYDDSDYSDYDD